MKNDHELKLDVSNELMWEPSVNETHIGVTAKDGIITLTGHVTTFGERYGAEKAAKRVLGVRAVANEIDVRVASDVTLTDEEIALVCVHALYSSSTIPDERLKLVVHEGWVTIDGTVDWQYQRTAAEDALRYLRGVRGITNSIEIAPCASATDVKGQIEAAFKRSAEIDAERIKIEIQNGKVVLRGQVPSWAERNKAQEAAWRAPGVVSVENKLLVIDG